MLRDINKNATKFEDINWFATVYCTGALIVFSNRGILEIYDEDSYLQSAHRYEDGKRWYFVVMSKNGETLDKLYINRSERGKMNNI